MSQPECVDMQSLRQLVANLQLDSDHIPSNLAIAADEFDRGNILMSEMYLIDALRKLRLPNLPFSKLKVRDRTLASHLAVRVRILTNIAVLHQRCGDFRSAERRYGQIFELNYHLLGTHTQLQAYALWCKATNTTAILLTENRHSVRCSLHDNVSGTREHAIGVSQSTASLIVKPLQVSFSN